MLTGLYFMFLRPPILPEDLRYMHVTLSNLQSELPGLQTWLKKVFFVMGGYIFTTGLLTTYFSLTSFKRRETGVFGLITFTGMSSLGVMIFINFLIVSDFKWVLLIFALPWVIALIMYRFNK